MLTVANNSRTLITKIKENYIHLHSTGLGAETLETHSQKKNKKTKNQNWLDITRGIQEEKCNLRKTTFK